MRKNKKFYFLVLLFLSISSFAIKRNVPGVYGTIQLALNSCSTGDTVLVQPGVYTEHIIWPNTSSIKLFSAGDSSNTIIDATSSGRCIFISGGSNSLDTNTIIKGFKLTAGYSSTSGFEGIAMYITSASVKLLGIAFCNNIYNVLSAGAGTYLRGPILYMDGPCIIRNSSFYNNTVTCNNGIYLGGLIYAGYGFNYSKCHIHNNTLNLSSSSTIPHISFFIVGNKINANYFSEMNISENTINFTTSASGAKVYGPLLAFQAQYPGNSLYMNNCLISNNKFSISSTIPITALLCYSLLWCDQSNVYMRHCTFSGNKLSGSSNCLNASFGVDFVHQTGCGASVLTASVSNTIFWNDSINATAETQSVSAAGSNFIIRNSDIRTYTMGINTINTNPQFVSGTNFHLQSSSSCINSGDSAVKILFDLDGTSRPIGVFPDMGCFEYNPSSEIKETKNSSFVLNLYPNPVSSTLYIFSENKPENAMIEVANAMGQIVLRLQHKNQIDISELSSGYYTLKVISKNEPDYYSKFIKR